MRAALLSVLLVGASAQSICKKESDMRYGHKYEGTCSGIAREQCNVKEVAMNCELTWNDLTGACTVKSSNPEECCAARGGTAELATSFTCGLASALILGSYGSRAEAIQNCDTNVDIIGQGEPFPAPRTRSGGPYRAERRVTWAAP